MKYYIKYAFGCQEFYSLPITWLIIAFEVYIYYNIQNINCAEWKVASGDMVIDTNGF